MNEENQSIEQLKDENKSANSHVIATGLGAAGGGVAGAAIGNSIAGKVGAAVGGVAGAIAGGIAGNAIAEFTEEIVEETSPSLSFGNGANDKEIELPAHYSWEELQAFSKV